jgi:hypothetical protein
MAKLSPQFVKYFIFASLALAFIFPITHSAYEGLENKDDDDEDDDDEDDDYNEYDDEDDKEGLTADPQRQSKMHLKDAKKALSREIIAQARANISTSSEVVNSRRKLRVEKAMSNAEEKKQKAIKSIENEMKAKSAKKAAKKVGKNK